MGRVQIGKLFRFLHPPRTSVAATLAVFLSASVEPHHDYLKGSREGYDTMDFMLCLSRCIFAFLSLRRP